MADDPVYNNNNDGYYRNAPVLPRSSLERGGRLMVPPRPASPKAPFEKVMDQVKEGTTEASDFMPARSASETSAAETHTPVNPILQQEERPRPFREEMKKRRQDSPSESQKGRPLSGSEKTRGKEAEQRVIARAPLSERQRDGKGGGEKQSSRQGPGYGFQSISLPPGMKGLGKGKIQELGQSVFLQNLKNLRTASETHAKIPTVFSKELIDQIVRYVRLLTKVDGEKEMDVSLHEQVFKGLRLKVVTSGRAIEATFLTLSPDVRELFLAHRRDIEQALKEKGIEVRKINVIMIQRA